MQDLTRTSPLSPKYGEQNQIFGRLSESACFVDGFEFQYYFRVGSLMSKFRVAVGKPFQDTKVLILETQLLSKMELGHIRQARCKTAFIHAVLRPHGSKLEKCVRWSVWVSFRKTSMPNSDFQMEEIVKAIMKSINCKLQVIVKAVGSLELVYK